MTETDIEQGAAWTRLPSHGDRISIGRRKDILPESFEVLCDTTISIDIRTGVSVWNRACSWWVIVSNCSPHDKK